MDVGHRRGIADYRQTHRSTNWSYLYIYTTIAALYAKICPKNTTDFYTDDLNSTPIIAYIFLSLHNFFIASPRPLDRSLFAFVLCFLRQKIKKNFASPQLRFLDEIFMRQLSRRCRHRYTAVATLTARWRYGTRSRAVAMSKSRPDVSKMTHGFFITINSVILYFKPIIHYYYYYLIFFFFLRFRKIFYILYIILYLI